MELKVIFFYMYFFKLADVEESMVRKAAVFCIVKLYFVMGEEKVKPKFALLNASKVRWVFLKHYVEASVRYEGTFRSRLLNVYISKNQGKGSSSSSWSNRYHYYKCWLLKSTSKLAKKLRKMRKKKFSAIPEWCHQAFWNFYYYYFETIASLSIKQSKRWPKSKNFLHYLQLIKKHILN